MHETQLVRLYCCAISLVWTGNKSDCTVSFLNEVKKMAATKRLGWESYEAYKLRCKRLEAYVKQHMRGRLVHDSSKYGTYRKVMR